MLGLQRDNVADAGHFFSQYALDPRSQSHGRHRTPLAGADKTNGHNCIDDAYQLDVAAIEPYGRAHL